MARDKIAIEVADHVVQLICWHKRVFKQSSNFTEFYWFVEGVARRPCGGPEGQRAVWETPDLGDCVSKWALEMKDLANDPNVSASSVADQIANLTDVSRADKIYPGDLKATVGVLEVVSEREEKKKVSDSETNEFTKVREAIKQQKIFISFVSRYMA